MGGTLTAAAPCAGDVRIVTYSVHGDRNDPFAKVPVGVDVLEGDRFGRLRPSLPGVAARDLRVAAWCAAHGVPLAATLSGGHQADVETTVAAHVEGLRAIAVATAAAPRTAAC